MYILRIKRKLCQRLFASESRIYVHHNAMQSSVAQMMAAKWNCSNQQLNSARILTWVFSASSIPCSYKLQIFGHTCGPKNVPSNKGVITLQPSENYYFELNSWGARWTISRPQASSIHLSLSTYNTELNEGHINRPIRHTIADEWWQQLYVPTLTYPQRSSIFSTPWGLVLSSSTIASKSFSSSCSNNYWKIQYSPK